MKNLQLSLKQKWFDLTKSGIKTEDYREINQYWSKRLCVNIEPAVLSWGEVMHKRNITQYTVKRFDTNTMTLGYPKSTDSERILKFEHNGIEIREGNPDWGAEKGKLYFVIKHGDIIKE